MAFINKLFINQFRNLNNQLIKPGKNINLYIADNAQGKTNLIEAIYYLGHNRSFKTKVIKELINVDNDNFQLNAITDTHRIKLEKSRKKTIININQQRLKNTSELAQILPMQIMTPDKGFIVNGTPKNKRSYLDWGVFHVKPTVSSYFKNYNKALKNINSLLLSKKVQELDFWFLEIAKISTKINQARVDYINQLKKIHSNEILPLLSELFNSVKTFDYQFKSGWPKEADALNHQSIYQYLTQNKVFLLKTKYLNYGPHKASIKFSLNAKEEFLLSRGEQKILSIIFWLTQVLILVKSGINPIVLIDDISSELDKKKIKIILHYLNTLDVQTFITNINHNLPLIKDDSTNIFHINKGVITPS
ncbi:DNA replication and repair protein RecF [Abyssogena phaseoliformis symbiont OG214]|nr:DNA replication and repair protein RecF [Abyssogena phaseoliformis symbiont OG214]